MSTTAEVDELHQLIGGLRRCVTSLASRYGDTPAMRRIANDAERILNGIDRLDRKNSSELLPERRPAHAPIRTDVAIAPNTRHQSSRLRRTVYLPSAKERVFSIFAKLATLI